MDLRGIVTNDSRQALDQILAVIPIVECARAEEQRNRRVYGRHFRFFAVIVPRNAQAGASQCKRLFTGRGQLQSAYHAGRVNDSGQRDRAVAGNFHIPADHAQLPLFGVGRTGLGRNIGSGAVKQVQNIAVRDGIEVPGGNRAR